MCICPMELKNALVTSYHILLEQAPPSPHFILSQRASPVEEQPDSAAPPTSVPEWSPQPKRQHLWRAHLWVEPLQRQPQKDPPALSGKKSCPGKECLSQAAPRHLAGTQTWLRKPGRHSSQNWRSSNKLIMP